MYNYYLTMIPFCVSCMASQGCYKNFLCNLEIIVFITYLSISCQSLMLVTKTYYFNPPNLIIEHLKVSFYNMHIQLLSTYMYVKCLKVSSKAGSLEKQTTFYGQFTRFLILCYTWREEWFVLSGKPCELLSTQVRGGAAVDYMQNPIPMG